MASPRPYWLSGTIVGIMGSAGTSFRIALSFSGSVVGVGRARANEADRRAPRMMEERMLIVSGGITDNTKGGKASSGLRYLFEA